MRNEERIAALEEENRKLRTENQALLMTIEQMNRTINRLLDRYVLGKNETVK